MHVVLKINVNKQQMQKLTGKNSSLTGKFHILPVMMTGRLSRLISRLGLGNIENEKLSRSGSDENSLKLFTTSAADSLYKLLGMCI